MKTCIHPRRAYNLMRSFLNTASDLYYTYDEDDSEIDKTEILLKKGDCFCATTYDCISDCDTLEIEYNFDELWSNGADLFRAYWTKKVPMLKGFSNITLTLLHELGHLETSEAIREAFSFEMRQLTWFAIDNKCDNEAEKNFKYFKMPDEAAATNWGINWLSNAENRKIAKHFEKEFWACFE